MMENLHKLAYVAKYAHKKYDIHIIGALDAFAVKENTNISNLKFVKFKLKEYLNDGSYALSIISEKNDYDLLNDKNWNTILEYVIHLAPDAVNSKVYEFRQFIVNTRKVAPK